MTSLLERLSAEQNRRFVGRGRELELFLDAIASRELPFHILHVFGPGGVGKTTLMQQFLRVCDRSKILTIYVEGRNLDALQNNPLVRSRSVYEVLSRSVEEQVFTKASMSESSKDTQLTEKPSFGHLRERVNVLQNLLKQAVESLQSSPRDEKLYRAVYRTYLNPAPTQEQAAELLGLPFSTYRRHLKAEMTRVADILWQREIS